MLTVTRFPLSSGEGGVSAARTSPFRHTYPTKEPGRASGCQAEFDWPAAEKTVTFD